MSILSEKAMLVVLNISTWTARKVDKPVTQKALNDHHATGEAGHFIKRLLHKDALADVITAMGAVRTFHYAQTSPWLDDGPRILSARNFRHYWDTINELKANYLAKVDAFLADYENYRKSAQHTLGTMFNPTDYPSRDAIERKFGCDVHVMPCPDTPDFRVDIGEEAIERVKRDIEARTHDALKGVTVDAMQRAAKVVGAMIERLDAYKPANGDVKATGVFRDTLVSNVNDLIDILPNLDIGNDPAIATLMADLRKLTVHTPETLRDDTTARETIKSEAKAILDHVSDFLA